MEPCKPRLERGQTLFDDYTRDYAEVLNRALASSGEKLEFFARVRVEWLQKQLKRLGVNVTTVLDYGCGTGGATPFLEETMRPQQLLGVDISAESVRLAGQTYGGKGIEFALCSECQPHNAFDLAFCNGVFHHIAPAERTHALRYIHQALRHGGIFALWENNPWNPGTHYVMSRCEFDRDAQMFNTLQAGRLLRRHGFEVIHRSSYFYFPRCLKWLRRLEPALASLPFGTQYLVMGRKRSSDVASSDT
jgi:SAM-dependent methyltransferase